MSRTCRNPPHDAEDVAAALKRTGFETIVGTDLDQAGMQNAAIRFARAARNADVAIFYYSGHAMQYAGVNYLVPIDAQLHDEADLRRMARVDDILADLQQAKNLRILVLDSCRDNPLADELKRSIGLTRSASIGRGLAKIDSPEGMVIAYATQAGRTAEDGDGRNSPYTAAFLKNVEAKEEIGTIFRRISADVYQTTRQTQLPELSLSLIGEFYLNGRVEIKIKPDALRSDSAPRDFEATERIDTIVAWDAFLAEHPSGFYSVLAQERRAKAAAKVAALPGKTTSDQPAQKATGADGIGSGKATRPASEGEASFDVTKVGGLTSEQIVRLLQANDMFSGSITETPREGTLLPGIYKFPLGTPRDQVIQQMQAAQRRVLAEIWELRNPDIPIKTPEQLVTLASIVEKETRKDDERSRIAAVFINRLRQKIKLQSDPTIVYGLVGGKGTLGRPIQRSEILNASLYNTYVVNGLPPGPVANPSRASLEAAANPARTRDLFFVADGVGGHNFSDTYVQHQKNVASLRANFPQRVNDTVYAASDE